MFGFTAEELSVLQKLRTPEKIQDFLDGLAMNFGVGGDTCLSPRMVLKKRMAHCMEGAMFAAVCLRLQGEQPLVMDLKSRRFDDDHVVTLFQYKNCYGAISKTNHGVLRYRDPIYKTLRELALSYFHEYFLEDGSKTLRTYSSEVDLSKLDKRGWMTSDDDVWYVPRFVDRAPHHRLFPQEFVKRLRKADAMERRVGAPTEWVLCNRKAQRAVFDEA